MEISPSSVIYSSPFTKFQVERVVTITNLNQSNTVAFKIKTNAPTIYSVRPNSGVLPPSGSINVYFHIHKFKMELSKGSICKDKFLVLSVPVHKVGIKREKIDWEIIEKTRKADILKKKINVFYEIYDVEKKADVKNDSSSEELMDLGTFVDSGAEHSASILDLQRKLNDAENKIVLLEKEITQTKSSVQNNKTSFWLIYLLTTGLVIIVCMISWYLNTK